jgi:hypothetical protein
MVAEDFIRALTVLLVFVVIIGISDAAGVPEKLPGVALGWNALFHVERAAALLGGFGTVLLVGARAMKGEFPIRFGQVEYAQKEANRAATGVTEAQERRLKVLEVLNQIRDPSDI